MRRLKWEGYDIELSRDLGTVTIGDGSREVEFPACFIADLSEIMDRIIDEQVDPNAMSAMILNTIKTSRSLPIAGWD